MLRSKVVKPEIVYSYRLMAALYDTASTFSCVNHDVIRCSARIGSLQPDNYSTSHRETVCNFPLYRWHQCGRSLAIICSASTFREGQPICNSDVSDICICNSNVKHQGEGCSRAVEGEGGGERALAGGVLITRGVPPRITAFPSGILISERYSHSTPLKK